MGTHHENGYSADVEGYFVANGSRIRLAKTNHEVLVLAEPCELSPGTEGDLIVIVDGTPYSSRVVLPQGVQRGETQVEYQVSAPF